MEQVGVQKPGEINVVSQANPVAHCVSSVQVLLHVDVIGSHTVLKQSASEEQLILQIPTTQTPPSSTKLSQLLSKPSQTSTFPRKLLASVSSQSKPLGD